MIYDISKRRNIPPETEYKEEYSTNIMGGDVCKKYSAEKRNVDEISYI